MEHMPDRDAIADAETLRVAWDAKFKDGPLASLSPTHRVTYYDDRHDPAGFLSRIDPETALIVGQCAARAAFAAVPALRDEEAR